MANVDNLNFKVIIDDKQFNQKIKAMEDMAKKFNTSMSNLLNVQAVSQQLVVSNRKRLQMETDLVRATEMQNREKIKTEGLQRKINAQIERASKGYQSQSRILQELKGYALGYLSIHGASQLLSSLVRVTGEFELQKTTLAAMLGDLNQAEQVITRIQGLAVESPFQFKELTTYAKQLSAFSVPAQELYDTTKMLADVSAGLGVGMDRIVLAYGQVRSAAFLRGQEVRQFTEAGIPILDELAKQFSELEGRAVSTGEVFDKISARLVPFEMVAKVFKDMTSEGGKFYNMQEVQAETLRGKISNLKDAYEVMLNEIGSGQSEKLKGAVDWARRLMQNYEETGRTLVELVAAYGIYRTTLSLTSNHITTLTRAHAALRAQMRNLTKLLTKNPYAALAVGVTAAIGLIYKLGKEMKSQSAISETLSKSQSEYAKNVEESTVALDALYAKINLAKKGTKDYNTALSTIQRTYAPYIEQLRSEGVEVDNLATLYSELTKKIKESAQARFVESARKDLDQTYAQRLSDIMSGTGANEIYNLKRAMESLNLNEAEGVVLRMFLSGSATWDEISEKYGELAEKVEGAYVSLGAGSSGPMKAKDYLDILKNSLTNLTNEYTTAIAVVDEFAIKMRETPEPVVLATGWRKTVQDTLTGMGLNKGTSFGLWAEDTTQSTEYVDDMIKRYKELGEQIKNVSSFDPDQTERLKQNKDAIEAIAKALNIDIKNLAANDSDTWESKEEKRLKRLIETLRKLQDQYDELKSLGVSDDAIKSLFKGWYPELGEGFFNDTDYLERAKDAAEELRKYNPGAADQALVNLGGDKYTQYVHKLKEQQKAYKESAQAAGEYFNMLRKWSSEDFNLNGEGIALDVSKIASDLSEKMNEIDLRARKAKEVFGQIDVDSDEEVAKVKEIFVKEFGADAWEEFWKSYKEKGENAINDLANKQKEYEKKLAQEKVNDLAKKYVSESTSGLDLKDWGDKSLGQVLKIKDALSKIQEADVNLPPELIKQIKDAGLTVDDFVEAVKDGFEDIGENVDEEVIKKIVVLGKYAAQQILEIASSLKELGEATGNDQLVSVANQIQDIGDVANGVMQGLATGGVAGAIIGGVGSIATKVIGAITEAELATQRANEAARQYAADLKAIEFDNLMGGFDAIFGTDSLAKAKEAKRLAKQYADDIKNTSDSVQVSQDDKIAYTQSMSAWANFSRKARNTANAVNSSGIGDILVDQRSGWQKFWGTGNDNVKMFSISDFFDEEGNLEGEELKSFISNYGDDISAENKAALETMLSDWELYEQAMAETTSYLSDMFGEVAGGMADSFIESFKASGEAALDYADIMDSVATNIAKSVVQSMIVDQIFTPEKVKEVSDLLFSGDTAGAMAVVDEAMQSAQELTPRIQEFLESMEPYFKMEDMESQNLGDGIKGITEDTANLLASYLNAIRADVSYARTIWERMDATTQQIAAILVNFSVPNLMEYQAQIAANTYNTAMHTQSIMEDLRSMMTTDGGGYTALRVYS
ncbi:MAG: hypothetical protein IJD91_08515 [Clostridia bacterium]|nr:hypothetical protein [Clostridia bacterium]